MIGTRTFYAVALALCAIQLLLPNTNGLQMTCEIPSVPLGHPTILTCHYNKNILESTEKIVVLHYCHNDKENPETILFNSFFDGKMEFYTHPDYVLNNTREIQVKIPRVTQKHVGRYVCLRLQSDIHEECNFTLKEHEATKYDTTSSTLIVNIPRTPESDDYPWAVIMGAVVGAIAIFCGAVVATIIFIFCRPRCAPGGRKCKPDDKPNNDVRGNRIQNQENSLLKDLEAQ